MSREDDEEYRKLVDDVESAFDGLSWPIGPKVGPRDYSLAEPDPAEEEDEVAHLIEATYEAQGKRTISVLEGFLILTVIGGLAVLAADLFSLITVSTTLTIVVLIAVIAAIVAWFILFATSDDDFDWGIRL